MRTVEPNGITLGSAAAMPTRVCAPDAVAPRLQYAVAVKVLARAGLRGFAEASTAVIRNRSASATTEACFIEALRVQRAHHCGQTSGDWSSYFLMGSVSSESFSSVASAV